MHRGGSWVLKNILERQENPRLWRWWWLIWLCEVMLSNDGYGGRPVRRNQVGTYSPWHFLWRFNSEWQHLLPILDDEMEPTSESLQPAGTTSLLENWFTNPSPTIVSDWRLWVNFCTNGRSNNTTCFLLAFYSYLSNPYYIYIYKKKLLILIWIGVLKLTLNPTRLCSTTLSQVNYVHSCPQRQLSQGL